MSLDQGMQAFEVESAELLEDLEKNLLILENSPEDQETINSIFRAVHTIKGSSGVVGLNGVSKFTHLAENLLVLLRDGKLVATPGMVELLLESRDHVANLIKLAINGLQPDGYVRDVEQQLMDSMRSILGIEGQPAEAVVAPREDDGPAQVTERSVASENWHISLRFGPETFRSGMDPMSFIRYLEDLGDIASLATITDSIPELEKIVHDICYLGFEIDLKTASGRKDIEDVFEFVQDDCNIRLIPPRAAIDDYIDLIKTLPEETEMLGEILVSGGALTPLELIRALKQQMLAPEGRRKPIGDILLDDGVVDQDVLAAAIERQGQARLQRAQRGEPVEPKGKRLTEVSKTIRVETVKLDNLMNIVGEMVIAQSNILQNSIRIADPQMTLAASYMSRLIQGLREGANEVRMIPIENLLSRYYRTVRDISSETGKLMELEINGGETEIDRNVAERLNDPMLHLIRNAADHGIESAQDRQAAGKPAAGRITINATQDAGSILVQIIDDGKGIDHTGVARKAISMGVINNTDGMSKEQILGLIFHAGLSTKEQASSFSGRGVGMDVVKRNIDDMRGKVDISSEPGKGTVISLRLPLTLAIIDAFMVRVGSQRFVIPNTMITECKELDAAESSDSGWFRLFRHRDTRIPFIRLREYFELDGLERDGYEYVVIVRHDNKEIGLAVDELFGEAQVVIKSLGRLYEDIKSMSGASILGDGSIALIMDVPQIVNDAYNDAAIMEAQAEAHENPDN